MEAFVGNEEKASFPEAQGEVLVGPSHRRKRACRSCQVGREEGASEEGKHVCSQETAWRGAEKEAEKERAAPRGARALLGGECGSTPSSSSGAGQW